MKANEEEEETSVINMQSKQRRKKVIYREIKEGIPSRDSKKEREGVKIDEK